MKIAIVGAGLTGLSAALQLKEYADVTLFERSDVGGLASSYCPSYCIEKFYHHCFSGDQILIDTLESLGLSNKLEWRTARTGYAIGDQIFPLNTPLEILKYPHMSVPEKGKLALFTLKSKNRDFKAEDESSAVEKIKEELGEELFQNFFLPLLRSKFGESYQDVSYAWLLARVAIRSNRKYGGEQLGYLKGGFHQMIEKMREGLDIQAGEVSISNNGGNNGGLSVGSKDFDLVIYTGPLPELDPELHQAAELPQIKYQSSVCALIGSNKSITEDIYWTNIKDELTFGAMVEHTNFMPFEDYGEHLIYLASYSTPQGWLFNSSYEELRKSYLKDVEKFGLKQEDINWLKIFRAKYSGPIYEKGYMDKITPYRTPVKGLYVAGMTSIPNYPERSMSGSIKTGMEVAQVVEKDMGFG
ncbi:MAG: NAD(P)/FAD-dependent oxidoreductase [Archaeoglobaceae archaeon]